MSGFFDGMMNMIIMMSVLRQMKPPSLATTDYYCEAQVVHRSGIFFSSVHPFVMEKEENTKKKVETKPSRYGTAV